MTAQLIDGKAVAAKVRTQVREETARWTAQTGRKPGLAVMRVGDDAPSAVYVAAKKKAAEEVGFSAWEYHLPENVTFETVLQQVKALNQNDDVDGILIQLPLPKHIPADALLEAIDPAKDVDGFHPVNAGNLLLGRPTLRPCTPAGVMRLLEDIDYSVRGKKAVVVGRSNIVGKPMSLLLLAADATVTVCHSKSNLPLEVPLADVVVAAVGVPNLVLGEWLKPGAVVIDVGMNRLPNGKLCGDVEFSKAKERASFITPVPGGVGPMTVAMLMENTLLAAKARAIAKK